jgi:hypothetical protein
MVEITVLQLTLLCARSTPKKNWTSQDATRTKFLESFTAPSPRRKLRFRGFGAGRGHQGHGCTWLGLVMWVVGSGLRVEGECFACGCYYICDCGSSHEPEGMVASIPHIHLPSQHLSSCPLGSCCRHRHPRRGHRPRPLPPPPPLPHPHGPTPAPPPEPGPPAAAAAPHTPAPAPPGCPA